MTKKRIRIGQIGIGHNHGADKMIALRALTDDFEVIGVTENDPVWYEKRKNLPAYRDLPFLSEDELLSNVDAVTVETDGFELVPAALRCAERNLHIHMDKPGGEDQRTFGRLLELCRSGKLAFQQAYVYRYNPALQFCMNAVRTGLLGKIFEIHAVMSRYDGANDFYRSWLAQFKGGAMYIFAGYLLDIILLMMGEPERVTPFMKQTRDDGLIDNGLAVLEYPGATATVRVSVAEVDGMKHRRFIICGTEGTVELCPIEAPGNLYYTQHLTVRLTLLHDTALYSAGTHMIDCGVLGSRYEAQLSEFARVIRGEISNPYPYEHEYQVNSLLLKACGISQ